MRSRKESDVSMDLLCDTLMVEEILPRLLPKCLIRLRAVSRRYNALALSPDFAARYWRRAGVLFQPFHPGCDEIRPHFLTAPGAQESVSGTDLSFLPGPSAREKDYLRAVGARDGAMSGIVVMHSTAGLLLCSRGCIHPVHFYICNPVTRQWVALPELPWPSNEWQCGLLMVGTNGDGAANLFKVVLFNLPMHWEKEGGCLDLRLFSSDTGRWEKAQLPPPIAENFITRGPVCGQSGTAYWTSYRVKDRALAYNGANGTSRFIPLPPSATVNPHPLMQIIGERQGGGLCFACCDGSSLEVWNTQNNQSENGTWMLVHRISIAELLEKNPEADAFLIQPSYGDIANMNRRLSPVSFHPTDDDVVFLSMRGAVAAYSIQHGTISIQCKHELSSGAYDFFPYVHPSYYPVQIPVIKNSNLASVKLNHS